MLQCEWNCTRIIITISYGKKVLIYVEDQNGSEPCSMVRFCFRAGELQILLRNILGSQEMVFLLKFHAFTTLRT
jgi:hypothetical protein